MARPCVLIVEDNLMLLQVLVEVLEVEGFTTLTAETGEAGLRLMSDHTPNLVVLDMTLPGGIDGSAVLRAIRNDPQLANTPVIVHTATELPPKSAEAQLADVVLLKPANTEVLVQLVHRLLKNRDR